MLLLLSDTITIAPIAISELVFIAKAISEGSDSYRLSVVSIPSNWAKKPFIERLSGTLQCPLCGENSTKMISIISI